MADVLLTFNRDAAPEDWCALPRAFKAGEMIRRFRGYDYGCAADDYAITGVETVACSLLDSEVFFTVPVHMLDRKASADA